MESVEKWNWVERKEVEVVKREERLDEMKVHIPTSLSYTMNGHTIRCLEGEQSWFIDRELKSVLFLFISLSFIC